jgi:hypothetical protein
LLQELASRTCFKNLLQELASRTCFKNLLQEFASRTYFKTSLCELANLTLIFFSGSRGHTVRSRSCTPTGAPEGSCTGPTTDVQPCDDHLTCLAIQSPVGFATETCKDYQTKSPRLAKDLTGIGKQMSFNSDNIKLACEVHCERFKNKEYYSPQVLLFF